MTGNCLNNNTEVYCVILSNTTPYNATNSLAILQVQVTLHVLNLLKFLFNVKIYIYLIQKLSQTLKYSILS